MGMSTSQVLDRYKGMDCDFLYYLEKANVIHPEKLKRGKLDRRIYSEEDTKKIGLIWQFYQRGNTPKEACRKAEEIMESDVSPPKKKLDETIRLAHEKGYELSGMSVESIAGILGSGDEGFMEDLTRVIERVMSEDAEEGGRE